MLPTYRIISPQFVAFFKKLFAYFCKPKPKLCKEDAEILRSIAKTERHSRAKRTYTVTIIYLEAYEEAVLLHQYLNVAIVNFKLRLALKTF